MPRSLARRARSHRGRQGRCVLGIGVPIAPVGIQAHLAVDDGAAQSLHCEWHTPHRQAEAAILSTYTRRALIGSTPDHDSEAIAGLRPLLRHTRPGAARHLADCPRYAYAESSALGHRPWAIDGLDSTAPRDPDVLSRARCTQAVAGRTGTVGHRLHSAVDVAMRTGKRGRAEPGFAGTGSAVGSRRHRCDGWGPASERAAPLRATRTASTSTIGSS
jgi:glutamyl-tRNA reductase